MITPVLLGILLSACQSAEQEKPIAQNGVIDFSVWDFEKNGIANLNGEWDFYWGKQIQAVSNDLDTIKLAGIVSLPGFWTEESKGDTYFEQNGLATYHLKIILPDTVNSYSLKLNVIYTSYALWADGQKLAEVGKPTNKPETTIPDFETKLIVLPKQKDVNLFLQIASWEHMRGGGTPDFFLISTSEQMQEEWLTNLIIQVLSFAIVSGLAIYMIVLFCFYTNDSSYLYVGLFALLGAVRAICVDEMAIEYLFNDFPYFWNQRLRYIGFFASIGFVVLASDKLFEGFLVKYAKYGAFILFAFSISILIIPFRWSSYLSTPFQIVTVIVIVCCFHAMYKTIRAKENQVEAVLFLIGGLVVFASMIHYLLYANNIIKGQLYHNFGYTFFIFSQILILAYRNKKTYNKANTLSEELSVLNQNLEEKVEERTQEISTQKNQISQQANELSKANNRLQELDEVKNRFFANISHELRTPLTLILGGTSKIKTEIGVDNKDVDLIERQSRLLHQLINQLLDLTKLESGKMELNRAEVPLIKLLRSYLYSFESLTSLKNITLQFESNVDELYVLLDTKALEKIIYNLLSNAYKFTTDAGEISLRVDVLSQNIRIKIEDSGIGIPEKELPFIFDRFYQVDASMQRNYEGTGIGLALVKELVELHNGSIEATSKKEIGTTFTLGLPLLKGETAQTREDDITIEIPKLNTAFNVKQVSKPVPLKDAPIVLIVEDHPELQDLISEELQTDYRILKADDGQAGVEMAQEHIPDIIISDVMMPYKNGYELCELVKKDERTSHIPVILLTARTAQENKLQGLEAGADDYLGKPFDSQELKVRVQNLIKSRQLLREKFSEKQEVLIYSPEEIVQNPLDKTFIEKLLEGFKNNFANEYYGVVEMAEALNISKRQLHRKLNAVSGLSPGKMLQNYRLQKAKELLETPNLQIKEVGFMVGFSSQSYFNKCFKSQFGMTPKQFQKEMLKPSDNEE